MRISRRQVMSIAGSVLISSRLAPLTAAEVELPAGSVRFRPEIEPLVRLLEDSTREEIFSAVAREIQVGRSYREILTALLLAGIRNVQPRPAVGFKFHSVLVINSAHLASQSARDEHRWLPLFWAIDNFKSAQQQDVKEGDWTMSAVKDARLPEPKDALIGLRNAMENWDEEAADAAASVAARVVPVHQLFDLFAQFGCRDFRSIGHKAIYVANSFRALQTIGWEHAEPVMRSLAYALLNHQGDPLPQGSDLEADRSGRHNANLAALIKPFALNGQGYHERDGEQLLLSSRSASPTELSSQVCEMLDHGVSADSIYDGLFTSAAELVMRQPGIVPLHAITTTNAIHYLYQHVQDEELRSWILLQNASFIGHFRSAAADRGKLADLDIQSISPAASGADLDGIFEEVGKSQGAERVLSYLSSGGNARELFSRARELVILKGNDAHDFKYSAALLEDYFQRGRRWQNKILAAGSFLLTSSRKPNTNLIERVTDAFS